MILKILLVLALALFLSVHVRINDDYEKKKDPYDYVHTGQSLVRGEGILFYNQAYVIHPPGFSLAAGGLNVFYRDPQMAGIYASLIFFIVSIFFVYRIADRISGHSFWAGLTIVLFCGNTVVLDQAVNGRAESLFVCLMTALVYMALSTGHRIFSSFIPCVMNAALAALLYYVRPEGALVAVVVGAWTWRRAVPQRRVQYAMTWLMTVAILWIPYFLFLKETTTVWQFSGKTTINLVMGELQSPYQDGAGGPRYDVIQKVIGDPHASSGVWNYLTTNSASILSRIPTNASTLFSHLIHSWSAIGLLLAACGVWAFPEKYRGLILSLLGILIIYLAFFILGRVIAAYHWIFCLLVVAGIRSLLKGEENWAVTKRYAVGIAFLITLYAMRYSAIGLWGGIG
jgi:hypothetical protein